MLEASSRLGGRAWTYEIGGQRLDLGCGWLHSGDRNSWTRIAEEAGRLVDRRPPKWGVQYRHLGFSPDEQKAARGEFAAWMERLTVKPPPSDCAADALTPGGEWNGYLQAISGFISGARLERISVADYLAYDDASTDINLRAAGGYGDLIVSSLPTKTALRLAAPVEGIELEPQGVAVETPAGTVRARTAILTVSTAVLASDAIKLPNGLDAWREAASFLPLGRDEKLFLEIVGESPFAPETHELGNPRDPRTAAYYIRPFGRPVIECFFGGEGAEMIERNGPAAGLRLRHRAARRALRERGPSEPPSPRRLLLEPRHSHRRRLQLRLARPRCGAPGAGPPLRGSFVLCRRSHERPRLLHRARSPRQRGAGGQGSGRCASGEKRLTSRSPARCTQPARSVTAKAR